MILKPGFGSGKTNYLLNSIQNDNNIIDKIYLYAKDLEESKYKSLINKWEKAGLKNLNDKNAFIEHSNTMDDILENILKELFIRCRKLNISLCFLTQSYFFVPKDAR